MSNCTSDARLEACEICPVVYDSETVQNTVHGGTALYDQDNRVRYVWVTIRLHLGMGMCVNLSRVICPSNHMEGVRWTYNSEKHTVRVARCEEGGCETGRVLVVCGPNTRH